MRVDDSRDDREPQSGAGAAALAAALGTPEALERIAVGIGQAGAVVADLEALVGAVERDGHLDRCSGRCVHERVAHQVGQHLPQQQRIADDRRGAGGLDIDGAVGRGDARVVDGVARERREVDVLAQRRADLVEPRERQQVLDEHAHARGLVLDPQHRAALVGLVPGRTDAQQLGVPADRRERRAQLVRGVGEEASAAGPRSPDAPRTRPRAGRASRSATGPDGRSRSSASPA